MDDHENNSTDLGPLNLVRKWKDDCSAYDYIEYLISSGEIGGPNIWRQVGYFIVIYEK